MTRIRLQFLYERYRRHVISKEELAELRLFISDDRNRQQVEEWLDGVWESLNEETLSDMPQERRRALFKTMTGVGFEVKPMRYFWWCAAAIVFLIAGGVLVFRYIDRFDDKALLALGADTLEDISPGANKAILTLADGTEMVLDDFDGDTLMVDQSVKIKKNADGLLVYESASADGGREGGKSVGYHTVTTPIGGQYRIRLPDGSEVTLNAASELRYPTVFQHDRRVVSFKGEGYFEVAPDVDRPFLVISETIDGQQTVEVLGTEFNINTYDGEHEIRTAVVSGRVGVSFSTATTSVVLNPGRQSILAKKGKDVSLSVAKADLALVAAWKDGLFVFENEKLPDLLKRVSRWYNVTFIYEGDMGGVRFQGNYFRNKGLLSLLKNLELTGEVDFLIEQPVISSNNERRIYVKKH